MRSHLPLIVAIALIGCAAQPRDDAEKLQGTWAIVSAEGLDAPDEALNRIKFIIRGDTMFFTDGTREREKSTFKLDPSQKPKAIDFFKDQTGPDARGIYELDRDTLKLMWRNEGPRPTEFFTTRRPATETGGTSEHDDLRMMTLKKEL